MRKGRASAEALSTPHRPEGPGEAPGEEEIPLEFWDSPAASMYKIIPCLQLGWAEVWLGETQLRHCAPH